MSFKEIAAALFVAALWGIQFVTSKAGVEAIPPLLFATLRFAIVAAVLLPFVGIPTRRQLVATAVISVFYGSLCFGLFFVGLKLGSAGVSAVLAQTMAPFTILFAWAVVDERPSGITVAGTLLAFTGVAIALSGNLDANLQGGALIGSAMVIAAAASQGFGNILIKQARFANPMQLMGWMSIFATPQLALASLLLEKGHLDAISAAPISAWASLAYAALFGAVVALGLWFWLLERLPTSRVAPYALLQTVFGMAAAAAFLSEPMTPLLVTGACICLIGVGLTQVFHSPLQPKQTHPHLKERTLK